MKPALFYTLISASFVATVIAMVACAPTDGRTPIERMGGVSSVGTALSQCRAQVRGKDILVEVPGHQVCEAPQAGVEDEDDPLSLLSARLSKNENLLAAVEPVVSTEAPIPASDLGKGYVLGERKARYTLGTEGDRLVVGVKAWLQLPEDLKLSFDARQNFRKAIVNRCVPKIKDIFKRSDLSLSVDLASLNEKADNVDEAKGRHRLILKVAQTATDPGRSLLSMAAWPDRGTLQAFVSTEDDARCGGLERDKVLECRRESIDRANNQFCVNMAMMIGQWVGLESVEVQTKTCGVQGSASNEKPGQDSSSGQVQGAFMKAGADRNEKGSKFWTTAKLSPTDIKTILGRECRSFKTEKDGGKVARLAITK